MAFSCETKGHNFQMLDDIRDENGNWLPVVFCTKCGEIQRIKIPEA